MAVFMSRSYIAAKYKINGLLGDVEEGAIVTLDESGIPIEFIVAKQDYESSLNGVGRVLLVRNDVEGPMAMGEIHQNNAFYFPTTEVFSMLNGDYLARFNQEVKTAMATTSFFNVERASLNEHQRVTETAAIFLPSASELWAATSLVGATGWYEAGPILPAKDVILADGTIIWTRQARGSTSYKTTFVVSRDSGGVLEYQDIAHYFKPCFTLPNTARVVNNAIVIE